MKEFRMRFPGGKEKALTFSYDDGLVADKRLGEIFNAHRLKGTFNINSGKFTPEGIAYDAADMWQRMTLKDTLAFFDDPLFEIACHGVDHPFLDKCDPAVAYAQIVNDRKALETLFGRMVTGMAYPYGTYNEAVMEMCRSAGIRYSRTTRSTGRFDLPKNWLELHPTCHHKEPRLMELAENFLTMDVKKQPQLFYVWGHACEFDADDNWEIIEQFADKMAGKKDIWYATNGEIVNYCRDFDRLQWTTDGSIIHNPTARTLWLVCNGETRAIASGETVKL